MGQDVKHPAESATAPGAEMVGHALLRLSARLYRLQAEALEGLDDPLTLQQYRLLDRAEHGVRSLGEHAWLAKRRPSTISKSADSLVCRGLLLRAEAPEDRRATCLSLTPRGLEALRSARSALDKLACWLAAGMDPEALSQALDGATRLYERAGTRIRSPR